MEANIQNELDIQLFRLNLGRCIDIATRWSLKGIKKNITDATPYSVFGSYLEPQMDYFENFKRALRLEFDNPQNGKGFEIDIKSKFLPMINNYYVWYDKHKSETTIFEPYNFYEWIYQTAKDTEQEIKKYFQIYSNEYDNTNPLIYEESMFDNLPASNLPVIDRDIIKPEFIIEKYLNKAFECSPFAFYAWLVYGKKYEKEQINWTFKKDNSDTVSKAQLKLFINKITNTDTAKKSYFNQVFGMKIEKSDYRNSFSLDVYFKELTDEIDRNKLNIK